MNESTLRMTILQKVAEAVTAHTSYPLVVQSDNYTLIDQVAQVNPWLDVAIDLLAADQADMADKPLVKQWGQLQLTAVVKEGSGAVAGATLRDFMVPYFDMQNLAGIQFQAAELHRCVVIKGWEYYPILVNLWYFRTKA